MTDITRFPQPLSSVRPLPALQDNYVWCIGTGPGFVVVDPGDAQPVLEALGRSNGAQEPGRPGDARHADDAAPAYLAAILVTHHHDDHTAGIAALKARWPQVRVIGPANCVPKGVNEVVDEGDVVEVTDVGLRAQVLATPGHTADHLGYFCPRLPGVAQPVLFCGDTLFAAGCGRVFDGTLAQLFHSLGRLATLPPDTLVCAAHEYTVTNLYFAQGAEPGNPQVAARLAHCRALRAQGLPTLPAPLSLELQTNPFLRSHLPALSQQLPADLAPNAPDPEQVFVALRAWRNRFRAPQNT